MILCWNKAFGILETFYLGSQGYDSNASTYFLFFSFFLIFFNVGEVSLRENE